VSLAALTGYAAAGLLVALCVVATLPHRRFTAWSVTAVLGIVAGVVGGLAGGLVLDVRPDTFFSLDAWAPAIAGAAVPLALWRAVAPPRS
jgi:uncharacterized membrane protein YeaQ/YmgE (transglycosylase-associated protein family)